jgi:hypothetical protein
MSRCPYCSFDPTGLNDYWALDYLLCNEPVALAALDHAQESR